MELRLLGPGELWTEGGVCHGLGPPRESSLLAMLALEAGTTVTAGSLAERLWDGDVPDAARSTLSAYLTRLRGRLRQVAGEELLESVERGYVLRVDRESVDVHRFTRLVEQAQALAESGDDADAVALLWQSEGLWRGEALAGLPGRRIGALRAGLEEKRRSAALLRVRLELRQGRAAELIADLRDLTARYELDEEFTAALMVALLRAGRQAEALEAYRGFYALSREHGVISPSPRLLELEQRILRRDPTLLGSAPALSDSPAPVHDLPADMGPLFGRDDAIARLETLLLAADAAPNVAVEGSAGVGKSVLAIHVAHRVSARFPDGCLYLRLVGHDPRRPGLDAAEALRLLLLHKLRLPENRVPAGLKQRAELWRSELARRRMLVVLDDAHDPQQLRPLLVTTTQSRVLITTRRRLRDLPHLEHVELDVLTGASAAQLLRATLDSPGHDENTAQSIATLCGRVPLAIKLAANWLNQGGDLDELANEIRRPGAGAHTDPATRPGAAIAAAYELSYRALTVEEQHVFRCIGMLPCVDLNIPGVAALTGQPPAAAETLMKQLHDHHLLQQPGPSGYRLLDLIHSFAQQRAFTEETEHERRLAFGRLLNHYLRTAAAADKLRDPHRHRLPPPRLPSATWRTELHSHAEAQAWYAAEWRNALEIARYAMTFEWKNKGAALIHCLAGFLETDGHWSYAIAAHTAAAHAYRELGDQHGHAHTCRALGAIQLRTGDIREAVKSTAQALEDFRAIGDPAGEADTLDTKGLAHWMSAQYRQALAHFQEAQTIYRRLGDRRNEATALNHCGIAHWHLGRYTDASTSFEDALRLHRATSNRRAEARTINNLGDVLRHCGYHRDALLRYRQSAEIIDEIGGPHEKAILDNNTGSIHRYRGRYQEALESYHRALRVHKDMGDRRNEADVRISIGATYDQLGQYAQASAHLDLALRLARDIPDAYEQARALIASGDVHSHTGNHHTAESTYQQAHQIAVTIEDPYLQATALVGIATSHLHNTGPDTARLYIRQAHEIYQPLGVPETAQTWIRLQTLDPPGP